MRTFIVALIAQTTLGACLSAPATLQRVVHEVRDLSQTSAFYEGCFGLSALPVDGRTVLAASSGAGLGLELLDSPRAEGYDAGGAYKKVIAWGQHFKIAHRRAKSFLRNLYL